MNNRSELSTNEPSVHLDALVRAVLEAAREVHSYLGPGFSEAVYEEALFLELDSRKIAVARQVEISIEYKGQVIATPRLDLVVEGELVVELKAVESLLAVHRAQVISYLKAGGFQLGLLINFNTYVFLHGVKRVIWNR